MRLAEQVEQWLNEVLDVLSRSFELQLPVTFFKVFVCSEEDRFHSPPDLIFSNSKRDQGNDENYKHDNLESCSHEHVALVRFQKGVEQSDFKVRCAQSLHQNNIPNQVSLLNELVESSVFNVVVEPDDHI